jgi:hypothetical protein
MPCLSFDDFKKTNEATSEANTSPFKAKQPLRLSENGAFSPSKHPGLPRNIPDTLQRLVFHRRASAHNERRYAGSNLVPTSRVYRSYVFIAKA